MQYVVLQLPSLDPQWVNVLALIVVAAATIYYAYYTRQLTKESKRTADEMHEARLAEIEPSVKASLGWLGPMNVSLKIQNLGRGPAKNVDIEYSMKPSKDVVKKWAAHTLAPGEFARLLLEPTRFDELVTKYDEIVVAGTCESVVGKRYSISDTLDLKKIHESIKKTPQIIETSSEQLLREIQEELEELNKNADSAIRTLKESGVVTKTKAEKASEDAENYAKAKELLEKAKAKAK